MKNNIIYKRILRELMNLGYNIKHIGTTYLAMSIYEIYNSDNEDVYVNIEKNIYSQISQKTNTKINTIKTDIIKATNSMYLYGNIEQINNYFHLDNCVKPTPKLVMITILNKL